MQRLFLVMGLLLGASLLPAAQMSTVLQVTATDDGLPDPARTLNYAWTVREAPMGAQVGFQPTSRVPDPTVSFDQPGRYVVEVVVDDGHLSSSQTVAIVVQGDPGTTQTPSSAGTGGCGSGSAMALLLGAMGLGLRSNHGKRRHERRLPTPAGR